MRLVDEDDHALLLALGPGPAQAEAAGGEEAAGRKQQQVAWHPAGRHVPESRRPRSQHESWKQQALHIVKQTLGFLPDEVHNRIRLLQILRLWYPRNLADDEEESTYVQRLTVSIQLDEHEVNAAQLNSGYIWESTDVVSPQLDPDILDLLHQHLEADEARASSLSFRELSKEDFLLDTREQKNASDCDAKRLQRILCTNAGMHLSDQKQFYRLFFDATFPRLFLTCEQFKQIMLKYGWQEPVLKELFRSFSLPHANKIFLRPTKEQVGQQQQQPSRKPQQLYQHLSFSEFVCGLCATEPLLKHGDQPGEARCRYIFRYYNHSGSGKLSFEEFCSLVKDIRKCKGFSAEPEEVQKEARLSAKCFDIENGLNSLPLNEFLTAVGQLRFRGTSGLLRSPNSAIAFERDESKKRKRATKLYEDSSTSAVPTSSTPPDKEDLTEGLQKRKRSRPQKLDLLLSFEDLEDEEEDRLTFKTDWKKQGDVDMADTDAVENPPYDFATHVVKVKRSGQVVDVKSLWDFELSCAVSDSSRFTSGQKTNYGRMMSMQAFQETSDANEMMKGLKYFERAVKHTNPEKPALSWGKVDMRVFGNSLIELCKQTRSVLIQEPRLLQLKSPTYILGDLHGNFRDVISFEKVLWRIGPKLTPASFLFLGDYVDRGAYGVEVVAYLFAQKLIAPSKFHLLRGNHECRIIQQNFTFYSECLDKFGPELGESVWENVNQAFDAMPIAATIDGKIFCVHGGIPPPSLMEGGKISALNNIKRSLADPELEAPLVWELLWNDPLPMGDSQVVSSSDEDNLIEVPETPSSSTELKDRGFADNPQRGTGHMFSDQALDDFLKQNGFSQVIRAHEVKQVGFQLQHRQKLLTVFSSSKYCGGVNEAACVLADNRKLRLIRLDTS